jgi:two-component system cell cycle response regulator DivK
MYAWCMRASGWNVAAVIDGEAALEAASTFEPDAIVMDLHLPVLDGIDAIRCLRGDARTARIPIVACTGIGRAHEAEARAAGCDEFVAKPCPPDDLCALLERLITSSDEH